jgi:hypothetical protein
LWVIGSLLLSLGGAMSVVALLATGTAAISHGRDELGFLLALTGVIVACGLVLVGRRYGLSSGFASSGSRSRNPLRLSILFLWLAVIAASSEPWMSGSLALLSALCLLYYVARRRRLWGNRQVPK